MAVPMGQKPAKPSVLATEPERPTDATGLELPYEDWAAFVHWLEATNDFVVRRDVAYRGVTAVRMPYIIRNEWAKKANAKSAELDEPIEVAAPEELVPVVNAEQVLSAENTGPIREAEAEWMPPTMALTSTPPVKANRPLWRKAVRWLAKPFARCFGHR